MCSFFPPPPPPVQSAELTALAALTSSGSQMVNGISSLVVTKMDVLDKRLVCLEEEARKAVTWPYILKTFVVPSMMALITLGLAYIFTRLAGASP